MKARTTTALLVPLLTAAALLPAHAVAAPPPAQVVIKDPAGDTRKEPDGDLRRNALADLLRVGVRTPEATSGTMTVRATVARLRDGSRPGVVNQAFQAIIVTDSDHFYVLEATTRRGTVTVEGAPPDGGPLEPITPQRADVDLDFGTNGVVTLRVSTEWLQGSTGRVTARAESRPGRGFFDFTGERRVRFGPAD